MTCVDQATWQKAISDCQALKSVKGLGLGGAYTRAGVRGLGFSVSASLTPASMQNFLTSGQVIQTAPPLPAAAAAPAPSTGYNIGPAAPGYDPCALAQQVPCASQGVCPPGWAAYSPGPGVTDCRKIAPALVAAPQRAPATPAPGPQDTAIMTPTSASTTAGGFKQWGLLAALAVGGFVVYKVATHKKS